MTRDADAILLVVKWAGSGDVATPESLGLTRSEGWPDEFSEVGGMTPRRRVFNQLFRELSALGVEINTHGGILAWDDEVPYDHPAVVMGSDNRPYESVQDSLNVDPTRDSDNSHWRRFGSGFNVASVDGFSLRKLTQAQYTALTPKDANTLYMIVG